MRSNKLQLLPVLAALSIFLSFLVPNEYPPWIPFYKEFLMAFAFLMLFFYCIYLHRQSSFSIPLASIFLILLPLLPLVQAALGVIFFWGDAWLVSFYLLGLALTFSLGFNFAKIDAERTLVSAGIVILFAAIVSSGIAICQWLEVENFGFWVTQDNYGERETGNLGQPNQLASLLLLGLTACAYLRTKKLLGGVFLWMIALFLMAGVALTESRTSWFAIGFLAWWWWIKVLPINSSIGKKTLLCLVAVYFIFYFLNTPISELLYLPGSAARGSVSAVTDGFVQDGRIAIWAQMFEAMKASPFWGYGWMQVSTAQVSVVADLPASEEMISFSHNIILDLLVWNGWYLGGVLIAVGVRWVMSRAVAGRSLETRIALLLIGLILVHSMLEFPFAYTYFLFPVAFLSGVVEFEYVKRQIIVNKLLVAAFVVISALILIVVWRDYRLIEEDFRRLRFEMVGLEPERRGPPIDNVLLLDQFPQYINLASMMISPGMTNEELRWMEKVCHRYPTSRSMFIYTSALFLNGQVEAAALELSRLKKLFGIRIYQEAISQLSQLGIKYGLAFDETALFLPSN